MRRFARAAGASAIGVCLAAATWGVLTAAPASAATARTTASLSLSPKSGPAGTVFTATFQIAVGAGGCPGGAVAFSLDGVSQGVAGLDSGSCSASMAIQVPGSASPGPHGVRGVLSGGSSSAGAGNSFNVTGTNSSPPPQSSSSGSGISFSQPPPNTSTNPQTTTSSTQFTQAYYNQLTPTTPWTPPGYTPPPPPNTTAPCDTTGAHATATGGDFLDITDYQPGRHSGSTASGGVSEPASGDIPITSVGPAGMTPPQLGSVPYQSLEIIEPYDQAVSQKLGLAAAAGEPFGCVRVEAYGASGSGYGYLVYALKGALVISAQGLDDSGTPTPAASSPSGAKTSTTPAPPKFERIVLGYSSITWEYQESAGGAQAPIHRGAGTIQPPPPAGTLSYTNLVFAFGGLVAATVALMFAYHSRRKELLRRGRRQRRSPGHA